MIVSTNIPWVINLRCDYKPDCVIVSLENVITGGFEAVETVHKGEHGWPDYEAIRNILVLKLRYNQVFSWQIAAAICHELHIPYERSDSTPREIPTFQQTEEAPLVIAVPHHGGLSNSQIALVAKSACSRLKNCLAV